MGYQKGIIFFAGALTGALASALGISMLGDQRVRPILRSAIRTGLEAKEIVLSRIETLREDVEDLMAEARHEQAAGTVEAGEETSPGKNGRTAPSKKSSAGKSGKSA